MNKILTTLITCLILVFLIACSTKNNEELVTGNDTTTFTLEEQPTATTSPNILSVEKPNATSILVPDQYVIGNTIKFGGYEWMILDVRDGKALLLTEKIIAIRYGNISNVAKKR